MKLNKAEKFVQRQFKLCKTRNGVEAAIFEKLGTWNFPPEYENALVKFDPLFTDEPLIGINYSLYTDENKCFDCGSPSESCFCGDPSLSPEAEDAVFGNKATQHEPCVFCQENPCNCAVIELPELPNPGTSEYEKMIDFMRADIAVGMGYSKIIAAAEKLFADRGLDLHEEFAKDQQSKKEILMCNNCRATWRRDQNSTGYCESCSSADVKLAAQLR